MSKINRQYGASNVLVRVYEKDLLSPEDFERMLTADDYEEAKRILDETHYHQYLEEAGSNLEEALTRSLVDTYKQISEISPSALLNEYVTLRFTYHNIKLAFKENIMESNLEHLYFPFSPFSQSAIDYAVTSGHSTRLPELYMESINEVRKEYDEYHDLYSIDVILDRRFLQHLRLLAEEIGDSRLIDYTEKFIDYRNVITLVRAMSQGRTRNFLNSVLSSSGSIPKAEIIDLARGDYSDVINYYNSTYLDKIIDQASEDEDIKIDRLEAIIDDEWMLLMQEGKRIASGPLPILAYVHAKEVEAKNLRILLFAKRTDMEVEEIRERMRLNYVT
ncbi:MAG TPA: V-type ATPase subunit [Atopostipes sp.]|nr:V-type ATPase subunit [Atopostipes sp.]